ncbi:hypothetical protein [Nonomuraea sp. NPDC049141]|uniref:hypothetical protein n=1 Tax=Nonomuraea sp. NPDC049141 TaxID=3155500 RepID=UPI0033D6C964
MEIVFIALLLLMLVWPVPALAALVLPALALRARARGRRWTGWWLPAAALCAAIATYGYGLKSTTFGALTDPDDRCGLVRPDLYSYGYRGPANGSQDMWPLHDTTCGPDLVPGFVNPLVAGAVALFAASVLTMTVVTIRARTWWCREIAAGPGTSARSRRSDCPPTTGYGDDCPQE